MMKTQHMVPDGSGTGLSQDLDLIEVLWRQDIDLGVGKDVFDVDLRKKLEQERELELQQQRAKEKQEELLRKKKEEERRQLNQQWLSQNFMQDGETGEWVPLDTPAGGLQTDIFSASNVAENFSLEEALEILSSPAGQEKVDSFIPNGNSTQLLDSLPVTPLPAPPAQPIHYFGNYIEEGAQHPNQSNQPQQLHTLQNVERQDSFLECLADLLDFNNLTQEDLDATRSPDSELLPNACHVNSTDVLLQNATMPTPAANTTLPSPMAVSMGLPLPTSNNSNNASCMQQLNDTEFLSQAENFSSTVPAVGSFESLDWEAEDIFSNVTAMNQSDNLSSVADLVLPEEAIHAGLQSVDMMEASSSVTPDLLLDEVSEDSAIESMGSASPLQHDMETVDGLEGATGGSDYGTGSPTYSKSSKFEPEDFRYSYSSYSDSESPNTNCSTSSNDTDFNRPSSGPPKHVKHNHTYPLQPGESPREVKAYTKVEKSKHKGPYSRDEKRVCDLNIPFTASRIINAPVEEFNEMMSKYKLTEPQTQLIRDIRRRGKNKVAAHNCRKRKMGILMTLEDELDELKDAKEKLERERYYIDKQTREMKEKFSYMYREIFNSLRDEHGNPYDANEYSLQQSSDGNVFLVPRTVPSDDSAMKTGKKRKNDKK
ncbi:endoplasmic reticulum membrane sensor NFE2L1-like isoform X2 [Gigantopelta aegis]|uniref:endoplasmic reticulum membrane sensor NFE2L1-like isoform X2 n=1 Tax=Gigantopelta aegis TaxID=1735272 RepID=UPI001B888898|nr:endoplasmic reticulum membrane sensor NFE2L1-like isoform X2 [Gigantopelta aegis]